MPLYRYTKAPFTVPRRRVRTGKFSFLMITLGLGMLVWVGWPIMSFSLSKDSALTKTIAPISEVRAIGVPEITGVSTGDFTNANAWYPAIPQRKITGQVNTYTLSVPKLKIADAQVIIGGDDLSVGLVHYGGTGLPGNYGTAVVFGHSTLPQFFSPTNYKSIFSLLPTLEKGDEIELTYDGVKYRYTVFEMIVVDPQDLSALEQHFDDSYLTLVTCVPPGTYWKRLNVRAKLVTPT